jgi:hypothetical protein
MIDSRPDRASLEVSWDDVFDGNFPERVFLHICKNTQYVDTHGQSEVAFAFCHLLGFNLMPRLKNIARQKLSLPGAGLSESELSESHLPLQ